MNFEGTEDLCPVGAWDIAGQEEFDAPVYGDAGDPYDAFAVEGIIPDQSAPAAETDMHQFYEDANRELRDAIAAVAQSSSPHDFSKIPGYIASGTCQHIFELPGEVVIKIPVAVGAQYEKLEPWEAEWAVDWTREARLQRRQVEALKRARGEIALEQIIDYVDIDNDEGGAVMCEKAPGFNLDDLPAEVFERIPKEHFDTLLQGLGALARLSLSFDDIGGPKNAMYHPEKGFTLIDLGLGYSPPQPQLSADSVCRFARNVLFQEGNSLLPQSARAFYEACKEALGEELCIPLKQQWRRQGYVLPDDL